MIFPLEFDYNFYIKNNNDLKSFTVEQANWHYNTYGIKEGRYCSLGQKRQFYDKININFNSCLEIGPFDTPILVGNNVKYFDVLNKEQLIQRANNINRTGNINNIPYIHYVDKNGNLLSINDKFDLILSCHSIEHQIDFIGHLNDVAKLLNNNGYYVIIIPDKRLCFDHFINESTIADILDAHYNKRTRHRLKSVIEHRALICHNNPTEHWKNNHGTQNDTNTNIKEAIKEYLDAEKNNTYIDVHAWQFTPNSFRKIIKLLNELGLINLNIERIYNTINNTFEFIAILKKYN
jgi:hypothetical protein